LEKIFDEVREIWVVADPEEIVRQNLLQRMMYQLGYPKSLLSVEKEIDDLPHVQEQNLKPTQRRADIICFAKDIHPLFQLYPLLMIECKAEDFNEAVVQQVMGYNHNVKAPFVAIANASQIKTFWWDQTHQKQGSFEGLPSFQELCRAIQPK